ncbi:hypothetical protein Q5O24_12185 [Eubacteriaceae bacterium ES3]|nr:hypothetical protein Q5O24_12185 [Eubacteriaceae bacterium ES3]
MGKKLKASAKDINGYALPVVLVLLSLLLTAASFLLAQQLQEYEANMECRNYELCLLTGTNALEIVKSEIESGGDEIVASGVSDPNGGVFSYHILRTAENRFDGEVISEYGGYKKKFTLNVEVTEEEEPVIINFFWKMEH